VRCTNTLTYLLKGTLRRCVCGDDAALRQITVAIYRRNRPWDASPPSLEIIRLRCKRCPQTRLLNLRVEGKRLSALCLESLELRRLKADLIVCFKILRGLINVFPSEFFLCGRHPVLEVTLWNCIIRIPVLLLVKFFFSVRVVQLWNKLPEEVVSASSVSAFISRLNSTHLSISFKMFFSCSGFLHLRVS